MSDSVKYESSEAAHVYALVKKLKDLPKARLYYYFSLAVLASDGSLDEDPDSILVDWIGGMIGLIVEELDRRGIPADVDVLTEKVRGFRSVN